MNTLKIILCSSAYFLFVLIGMYASFHRKKDTIGSSSSHFFNPIVKQSVSYSRSVQEIKNQPRVSCQENDLYNKISCAPSTCNGHISSVYFRILKRSCSNSANDQGRGFKCYDRSSIVFPTSLRIYSKNKKNSRKEKGGPSINILYDGLIQSYKQVISFAPSDSKVYAELRNVKSGAVVQEVQFYADCSKPFSLKDSYGALQVVEIKDATQHLSCCMLPTPFPSVEPSSDPTSIPSYLPTSEPSYIPSSSPSFLPSILPTFTPSDVPSSFPTCSSTTCVQNPDHIVFEVKPFLSCEEAMNPTNKSAALVNCMDTMLPTFPLQLQITSSQKSSKSKKSQDYVTFDIEHIGQKFVLEGDRLKKMPKKLELQFSDASDEKDSIIYQELLLDSSCYESKAFSIGDRFGILEIIGFSNTVQGTVACF